MVKVNELILIIHTTHSSRSKLNHLPILLLLAHTRPDHHYSDGYHH